jgi:hypothetical protein
MASSVKYHKTYLKLHKEYEAYAYPIIKKALDDQTGAVADFVNEDTFDNIELYIQFLVQQKPLYSGLEKIYTRVGVSAATFSYDWIRNSVPKTKKDFIIDFFNAEWYEEMVNYFRLIGGTKVTGIDDTTRNIVKTTSAGTIAVTPNTINASIITEVSDKIYAYITLDPLQQNVVGTQFQLNYDNSVLKFESVEFKTKGSPMNYSTDKGNYINLGSLISDGSTALDNTTEYKITFTSSTKLDNILGLISIGATDAVNKAGTQLKVKVN